MAAKPKYEKLIIPGVISFGVMIITIFANMLLYEVREVNKTLVKMTISQSDEKTKRTINSRSIDLQSIAIEHLQITSIKHCEKLNRTLPTPEEC